MPCTSYQGRDWPTPWVELEQNTPAPGFAFCSPDGGWGYAPVGGWEVGARPSTITLTLDASVASPTQRFSIYDTNGVEIGTAPVGVPSGISTKVISLVYGSFDIDYMFAPYVSTGGTLLITAVDGPTLPVFWKNFRGQYEAP